MEIRVESDDIVAFFPHHRHSFGHGLFCFCFWRGWGVGSHLRWVMEFCWHPFTLVSLLWNRTFLCLCQKLVFRWVQTWTDEICGVYKTRQARLQWAEEHEFSGKARLQRSDPCSSVSICWSSDGTKQFKNKKVKELFNRAPLNPLLNVTNVHGKGRNGQVYRVLHRITSFGLHIYTHTLLNLLSETINLHQGQGFKELYSL